MKAHFQMTGSYYSTRLQPASEVAELVDRASVTACNKQADRQRAPIPSLQAGWGSAHCTCVNAVSSGGWPSMYSVCV